MLRGAAAAALSFAIVACQPPASEADAAQPVVQQDAAPEYLNPNPRAPYSEGVRHGGYSSWPESSEGAGSAEFSRRLAVFSSPFTTRSNASDPPWTES